MTTNRDILIFVTLSSLTIHFEYNILNVINNDLVVFSSFSCRFALFLISFTILQRLALNTKGRFAITTNLQVATSSGVNNDIGWRFCVAEHSGGKSIASPLLYIVYGKIVLMSTCRCILTEKFEFHI